MWINIGLRRFAYEIVPVPDGTHALCALVVASSAVMCEPYRMNLFLRAFACNIDFLLVSARGAIACDRCGYILPVAGKLLNLAVTMLPRGLCGLCPAGAPNTGFSH